ncbi:MAG: M20 family metallopeptidase [Ktedonobacterales bacterium]
MTTLIERLTETASSLIGYPTVAGSTADIAGCLAWVRAHVTAAAPDVHMRDFEDAGHASLLLAHGETAPRVLLCGHLDVVPADATDFAARRLPGSRLGGRGAADMKGPIAALLDVFVADPLPGLGLLLTSDEETGGTHGTGYVFDRLPDRPRVVLLPDGGATMRLVAEQKGVLRMRVIATGHATHGARPWLGQSAIERLMAGYRAVLRAFPQPTSEDDWRPSIALTQLNTDDNAANAIPGRAYATLDIRYPADPAMPAEALFARISARLRRYSVVPEDVSISPAFQLDVASPWVARLQATAQAVRGEALPLVREAGASDARFFAAAGIPVLIFQPECAGWHGPDEWVNVESLAVFREVVARFVRESLA